MSIPNGKKLLDYSENEPDGVCVLHSIGMNAMAYVLCSIP